MLLPNAQFHRRVPLRIARWIELSAPTMGPLLSRLTRNAPRFFRWLWALFLGPFWLSFEAYIALWNALERVLATSVDPSQMGWLRLVFCLVLSLTVGQLALLIMTHVPMSIWTFSLSLLHGCAVHVFWERGKRWCKRQLGLRPSNSFDPRRPYDHLDLWN